MPQMAQMQEKTMLIYDEVTALSRDEHKSLRLKPVDGYGFTAHMHWSPVAGPEFFSACRHYPIVFVRENTDATVAPILLLGFESGRNCYLDADGRWLEGTYIPAFFRRYPFLLADNGQPDDSGIVCFDASHPGFGEEDGEPLFGEEGANTEVLDRVVQFATDFRAAMRQTNEFISLLERFDLFEERSFDIRSESGATLTLNNIIVVSETKFSKLFGAQLAQLNNAGFLNWIVAHHLSLTNLPRLLDRQVAFASQNQDTKQ